MSAPSMSRREYVKWLAKAGGAAALVGSPALGITLPQIGGIAAARRRIGGGIEFVSAGTAISSSSFASDTIAFTTGALVNGYIVFGVASYNTSGATLAARWDTGGANTAMALIAAKTQSSSRVVYLFGLAVGTVAAGTYTCSLTATGGTPYINANIASYSGVHQSASVGTDGSGGATSGTTSSCSVTLATGEVAVGITYSDSNSDPSSFGTGQTKRWQSGQPGMAGCFSDQIGSGSVTHSYSPVAATWAVVAIPLKPA